MKCEEILSTLNLQKLYLFDFSRLQVSLFPNFNITCLIKPLRAILTQRYRRFLSPVLTLYALYMSIFESPTIHSFQAKPIVGIYPNGASVVAHSLLLASGVLHAPALLYLARHDVLSLREIRDYSYCSVHLRTSFYQVKL